ncbi:MAG: PRC-barrel domain-containing protein [Pseudomonadaceae bacterium]|nr:PRC-barrel domain-containing protein [Pseudomonadaceae bacterium]
MQELSKLFHGKVSNEKGQSLGYIEEVLFCGKSGRIRAVIVKAENHTRMRVPWTDLSINDDSFVVQKTRHLS